MIKRLVSVALIVAACSNPTGVSSNVGFTVVRQAATQDPNVTTIEFVLTNTGPATLYLSRCGESVLTSVEELRNGEWIITGGSICLAIKEMHGIQLAPNTQITGIRQVVGSGQFRLRAFVSADPGLVGSQAAISAPFVID